MTKKRKKVLTAWMVKDWKFKWVQFPTPIMSKAYKDKKYITYFCENPNPVRVRITVEEI